MLSVWPIVNNRAILILARLALLCKINYFAQKVPAVVSFGCTSRLIMHLRSGVLSSLCQPY